MKLEKIFIVLIVLVMIFSISSVSAANLDNNDSNQDIFNNQFLSIDNDKEDVQLISGDFSMYYKNGSRLEASLFDMNNNPIVNASVDITIVGKTYNRITDENGLVALNINLNPDVYQAKVYFSGNSIYNNASKDVTVTVLNGIYSSDLVKIYKNDSQFLVTVVDGKGNPLVDTDVCINILGKNYYRTTNDKGVAQLNINLVPGSYNVITTNPINGFSNSNLVTVLSTVNASDVTKGYRDNQQFYATFVDKQGNPLVDTEVCLNIVGKNYYRTTDENGVAQLNINLGPGKYTVISTDPSNGLKCTNTVTVLSGLTTYMEVDHDLMIEGTGGNIYVTLYDSLGNTIPNEKVTISINKQSYTLTTDSEGHISQFINFTAGNYSCKVIYDGNNYYKSSNINLYIYVQRLIGVNFTVISENELFNGDYFEVLVQDEYGNLLKDIEVDFSIGLSYHIKTTTNSEGIAKFKIDLPSGLYLLEYNVNSMNYSSEKDMILLNIYDTSKTHLVADKTYVIRGTTFDVSLYSGNMPIANKTVIISVAGKDYYKVTDELGVAHLTINLLPGTYDISYRFEGDSKFGSSSGSTSIDVYENITNTILKPESTYEFIYGKENYFMVKLTDINGNALPNQKIHFYFDDVVFEEYTDEAGLAGFKLNNGPGVYPVFYEFEGTYAYNGSSESTFITIKEQGSKLNAGYYLNAYDLYDVNLKDLSEQGTNVIILNSYVFSMYGKEVTSWIKTANSYGIQIFVTINAFYEDEWINPVNSKGEIDYNVINNVVNKALKYMDYGVNGIILDYFRYPGNAFNYKNGADAITECALYVNAAAKEKNPNIIVGAMVMPETTSDKYYYGQDIPALSKCLDYIIPMVYKGNYNSGTSWISSTSKWFQTNSQGAEIWVALESYVSDSNVKPLGYDELFNDAQTAIDGGVDGVLLFRFGLSPLINFNDLDYGGHEIDPVSGVYVSINDILKAASALKESLEKDGILVDYITVGSHVLTMPQFLYLLTEATVAINNNDFKDIKVINVSKPVTDSGDLIYADLEKVDYIDMANRVSTYIENNDMAPAYASSSVGKIKYSSLVYAYTRVLSYYSSEKILPYRVYITNFLDAYSVTVTMRPSSSNTTGYQYIEYTTTWLNYCPKCNHYGTLLINPKGVYEGELTCSYCDSDFCGVTGMDKLYDSPYYLTRLSESIPVGGESSSDNLTLSDILDAATRVKNFIEANGELPNYVVIGGANYECPLVLYLFSKAIVNINNNNFGSIDVFEVKSPQLPTGDVLESSLTKAQYLDMFLRVANFIKNNELAPNYASSSIGKIRYDELIDSSSRILAYYNTNKELPSSVKIVYKGGSSKSIANLTASLIAGLTTEYAKAQVLYNYVRDNIAYEFYYNTVKGADGTLTTGGGNCCDQAQLLIAMLREAGLTCRFVHGTCSFTSGGVYGHVWAQIYLDGKWVVADPTSTRNSLGVINNWNTNSYTLHGYYDVLPF